MDDQLKPIYNSSVPIQDIDLKTSREGWTVEMGGEKDLRQRDMMNSYVSMSSKLRSS